MSRPPMTALPNGVLSWLGSPGTPASDVVTRSTAPGVGHGLSSSNIVEWPNTA